MQTKFLRKREKIFIFKFFSEKNFYFSLTILRRKTIIKLRNVELNCREFSGLLEYPFTFCQISLSNRRSIQNTKCEDNEQIDCLGI